jgi:5'-nucleotidase
MLITNSEWSYTSAMMSYSFNRFLPSGMKWQDLFSVVIVDARKPLFFTGVHPIYEVIQESGFLKPVTGKLTSGRIYSGGNAAVLEKSFGFSGDEMLYVGDHMFGDVHVSKNALRWRTALVLRELEDEIKANELFISQSVRLDDLMQQKETLESQLFQVRIQEQRSKVLSQSEITRRLEKLDEEITPLVIQSGALNNPHWGLLLRAGNDKSYLAYQLERYADLYTSRVSNFLETTPFSYFRSPKGILPHDRRQS